MRWALVLVLLLGACRNEPSFDERYAAAGKAIESEAAAIDADLARRSSVDPVPPGSD